MKTCKQFIINHTCIFTSDVIQQQSIYLIHVVTVSRDRDVEQNFENLATQVDLWVADQSLGLVCAPQGQVKDFDQVGQAVKVLA